MKKMLVAILAVALLLPAALLCLPVGAAGTGRLALTSGEAKPGETFDMILSLEENPGLNSLQLEIAYDTTALELVEVVCTNDLGQCAPNAKYDSPYKLTWLDANQENNTYTGTLATLTFRAKSAGKEALVTATVTSSVDVDLQKNEFPPVTGKITIAAEKGDIDENGTVDSDDAIYLLYSTLLGTERYPLNQHCDYTRDGTVDSDDAIYLLYHTLLGADRYPLDPLIS